MLLQTSFHAVDTTPSHLQPSVDSRWVEACFQQLFDLLLYLRWLFACARHIGCQSQWFRFSRVCGGGDSEGGSKKVRTKRRRSWRWDARCVKPPKLPCCLRLQSALSDYVSRESRYVKAKHLQLPRRSKDDESATADLNRCSPGLSTQQHASRQAI